MRRQSKKTAALYREHGPARRAFVAEYPCCAVCGTSCGVAVHEIAAGSNRLRAFSIRALWLTACGICNCGALTDPREWPIIRQLALKRIVDPEGFDLQAVNKVFAPEGAKKVPERFTLDEVIDAALKWGHV